MNGIVVPPEIFDICNVCEGRGKLRETIRRIVFWNQGLKDPNFCENTHPEKYQNPQDVIKQVT